EIFLHIFHQHAWSKWPKRFAELDPQVHRGLHLLVARIADDAPRSQCARPEFHSPMKPTNDQTIRNPLSDCLQQFFLAPDGRIRRFSFIEKLFDFSVFVTWAEQRAF